MRLLVTIGLTLLVGGAWAQHSSFFNIESDTDLLALPSDQLIHSDVDLEAVESIVPPAHQNHELLGLENLNLPFTTTDQLPFGARLPGYERIQYAYGYQIPEKAQPKTTMILNGQTTAVSPVMIKPLISPTEFKTTLAQKEHKITTKTETPTSIPSTYFASPSGLRLSLPEREYLPPAATKIASEPLHTEVKNKASDLSSLAGGYLPPTNEFETKPPPLPPNTEPVIKSPEPEKTVVPLLSDGYLPPVFDFNTEPSKKPDVPTLSDGYLPPVFDFKAEPPEKTDVPPLLDGYLPPVFEFEKKPPPPTTLPVDTYLPPFPNIYIPPVPVEKSPEKPIILIPLPSPLVPPQSPLGAVLENQEINPLGLQQHVLRPLGVVGDHEQQELRFDANVTPAQPFGVVGEQEEPGFHFSAQVTPAAPFGVIGEHEDPVIKFRSQVTPAPPSGIIGEREEPTLKFHAHVTPASPFGVVGDHKESVLQFSSQVTPAPPFGVVGVKEEPKLKFKAQVTPAPPSGVVGEKQEPPLRFQAQVTPASPFGVVGDKQEPALHFSAEKRPTQPYGVIGEKEEPKLKFKAEVTPAAPVALIGDHKDSALHFDAEITPAPPYGIVGEEEDQPVRFKSEVSKTQPLGVVGEHKEPALQFDSKVTPLKPLGVIGEQEDSPVRFSAEKTDPPAYGLIGQPKEEIVKPISEISQAPPLGVISETKDTTIKAQTARPLLEPFGVIGEITENAISAHADTPSIVIGAIPRDNPDCTRNTDCSEDQICMDSMCVNACVISVGICVGNAVCHARRHTPGCICPDMFTAVTIRGQGRDIYDCMPMMMMSGPGPTIVQGRVLTELQHLAPIANHRQNFDLSPLGVLTFPFAPLVPLAPIAVFPERHQGRITSSPVRQTSFQTSFQGSSSDNPCQPSPCGPNTRCEVSNRGIALCRCLDDFVPDGNTINGCKPQCVTDDECPDDYRCRSTKCVRVCVQGACGINADCDSRNHRAICSCPSNYNGDPHIRCTREQPKIRVAPPAAPIDPCSPNPCGSNADCRVRGDRPVCTCPIGYEGDPLTNCRRGECIEANDCPGHLTCQRLRCIDPCQEGVCGSGSECTVRNHQPICSCPRGHVGDPFTRCRRFDPQELCNPSPCGQNTNCKISPDQQRAVCSCIENYIGNPLTGCRPECVTDTECPHSMACRNSICVNPCRDACGEGAYCEVRNSRAVCSCPQYYQGDPYSRCYAECTAHDDCPSYQACFQLRCIDPCEGSCGTGANCKVDDHKPICSCPKGYTGHPFESCRPFTAADLCNPNPCGSQADCTPGFDSSGNDRPVCTCPVGFIGNPLVACQRGECTTNDECSNHEACYAYTCQNPCYTDVGSVCGDNAECTVKNHQPVCSCPPGYDGNPLTECRIGRGSSFIVGRSRRK